MMNSQGLGLCLKGLWRTVERLEKHLRASRGSKFFLGIGMEKAQARTMEKLAACLEAVWQVLLEEE